MPLGAGRHYGRLDGALISVGGPHVKVRETTEEMALVPSTRCSLRGSESATRYSRRGLPSNTKMLTGLLDLRQVASVESLE